MNQIILSPNNYNVSNWSGGQTTELFIYPKESDYKKMNFDFRLSSATVENKHATFTPLEGVNRFIATIDGQLTLIHQNQTPIDLEPFECHEFSGDIPTNSIGIVKDFNLMCSEHVIGSMTSTKITSKIRTFNFDNDIEFVIVYSPKGDVTCIQDKNHIINSIKSNHTLIQNSCDSFNLIADEPTDIFICTIKYSVIKL